MAEKNLSGAQWAEIASGLGKSASSLIDKEHPKFVKLYGGKQNVMEGHSWVKILDKHPEVVSHPILSVADSYHEISTPSDITKHIATDSAGIEERNKK